MEANVKDNKEYELGFLLKEEGLLETIVNLIRSLGGEITTQGPVSRIPLAYEVKKEKEAFFGFVQFMFPPSKVSELTSTLELNGGVLRHLIVTPPPMKATSTRPESPEAPRRTEKPFTARSTEQKPAALSNEALEKKIEEILQ